MSDNTGIGDDFNTPLIDTEGDLLGTDSSEKDKRDLKGNLTSEELYEAYEQGIDQMKRPTLPEQIALGEARLVVERVTNKLQKYISNEVLGIIQDETTGKVLIQGIFKNEYPRLSCYLQKGIHFLDAYLRISEITTDNAVYQGGQFTFTQKSLTPNILGQYVEARIITDGKGSCVIDVDYSQTES